MPGDAPWGHVSSDLGSSRKMLGVNVSWSYDNDELPSLLSSYWMLLQQCNPKAKLTRVAPPFCSISICQDFEECCAFCVHTKFSKVDAAVQWRFLPAILQRRRENLAVPVSGGRKEKSQDVSILPSCRMTLISYFLLLDHFQESVHLKLFLNGKSSNILTPLFKLYFGFELKKLLDWL